jgi:hypothetical protein
MKKKAYNTIRVVIGAAKITSLLHMAVFLYCGEYPSVLYRVAGCKTVKLLYHFKFILITCSIHSGACQGCSWSLQLTALHGGQEDYVVIISGQSEHLI